MATDGWKLLATVLLPSGIYQVSGTSALGGCLAPALSVEAPQPPATNTTCATATRLPVGSPFTEARITTPGDRYYSFTTTSAGLTLTGTFPTLLGYATVTLYSNCTDPTSKVGTLALTQGTQTMLPNTTMQFPGLPPSTYWLDVSQIELGAIYELLASQ